MEFDEHAPLLQTFKRRRKAPQKKNDSQPARLVSEFDYSVENHFKFVDTMANLCGYPEAVETDPPEIKRSSDSITFLREWRDFNYKPRVVKFACQPNSKEKDMIGGVNLSQFSAASVPKKETQNGSEIGVKSCKDFVMNVGGSVWALDWCPRVDKDSENCIKSEFVAVAAHPPDTSYHKIGAPLVGRGAIQIWCLLTDHVKEGPSQGIKKSTKVPRPRGRPRKKPLTVSVAKRDADNEPVQPLAVEYPMGSPAISCSDSNFGNAGKYVHDEDCARIDKDSNHMGRANTLLTACGGRVDKPKVGKEHQIQKNDLHFLRQCEQGESVAMDPLKSTVVSSDSISTDKNLNCITSFDANTSKNSIPVDVALPRMMFCLAHNGKVAWDAKWQPVDAHRPKSLYMMGYLAVILGNGALEVWEVPLPHTVKVVYPAFQEHIDPRFIKLRPVFRCSMLKCGDRRSIPLTVEWSVSSPNDMILAGCHDGVVVLWKFSVTDSLTETRPLLSFSADTGPIRTLSWAPNQSDVESRNIIVTGGHKGFKFWDIRDPFHPLSEHPFPAATHCLDWLPDPRCVFGSTEEGTMWLLSLEKAAHDFPITEKYLIAGSKHGFHNFDCSSFSLWCLQASRLTGVHGHSLFRLSLVMTIDLGVVAYCGEEGSAICFKPTSRSLRDPSRNRVPHCLCGSLLEEENAIIVASPLPHKPFRVRFPSLKRSGSGAVKEPEKRAKERVNKSSSVDQPPGGGEEAGEEYEIFPPKNVALHRVRWNVNKGSEKWLCYGGAAGLLRCQQIDSADFQ